jgi:hypothetical protein
MLYTNAWGDTVCHLALKKNPDICKWDNYRLEGCILMCAKKDRTATPFKTTLKPDKVDNDSALVALAHAIVTGRESRLAGGESESVRVPRGARAATGGAAQEGEHGGAVGESNGSGFVFLAHTIVARRESKQTGSDDSGGGGGDGGGSGHLNLPTRISSSSSKSTQPSPRGVTGPSVKLRAERLLGQHVPLLLALSACVAMLVAINSRLSPANGARGSSPGGQLGGAYYQHTVSNAGPVSSGEAGTGNGSCSYVAVSSPEPRMRGELGVDV